MSQDKKSVLTYSMVKRRPFISFPQLPVGGRLLTFSKLHESGRNPYGRGLVSIEPLSETNLMTNVEKLRALGAARN